MEEQICVLVLSLIKVVCLAVGSRFFVYNLFLGLKTYLVLYAIFCCLLFENFLFQVHVSGFLYGLTSLCIIQHLTAQ